MKTLAFISIIAALFLSFWNIFRFFPHDDDVIQTVSFVLHDHNLKATVVKKVETPSAKTPTQFKTSPKPCNSKQLKYIVDINNRNTDENESTSRLIPNTMHQTSRDRCVDIGAAEWISVWRNSTNLPGINHFFYDDEDINSFLFDKERWENTFPSLNLALQCIDNAAYSRREKAALWKYLILWDKGGMYANLDTIPHLRFTPSTIKPDDDAVIFHKRKDRKNISEDFLAVSPHHPLIFHALNQRINRMFSNSTEPSNKGDIQLALDVMSVDIASASLLEQEDSITIEGTDRSLRIFGGIDYRVKLNLAGGKRRKDRIFLEHMNMNIHPKNPTIPTCSNNLRELDTAIGIHPAEEVDFSQPRSYVVQQQRNENLTPLPKTKSNLGFVFPDEVTSLDVFSDNAKYLTPPKNLRLAFIGDSLTRYQYIDLVYYLKFGKWNSDDKMIYGPYSESWNDYFNYTKTMLEPFEECDCSRPTDTPNKLKYQCENRYYWDPRQNHSVSFLTKNGDKTFTSSWNPKKVHKPHNLDFATRGRNARYFPSLDWTETITKFVSRIFPKPEIVIFNAGAWPHEDFEDKTVREEIVKAISDNGMISVYKTTTASKQDDILKDYEKEFCKITDYCLDLASWTAIIHKEFFVDDVHFLSPTYSWMNIALLDLLATIEKDRI